MFSINGISVHKITFCQCATGKNWNTFCIYNAINDRPSLSFIWAWRYQVKKENCFFVTRLSRLGEKYTFAYELRLILESHFLLNIVLMNKCCSPTPSGSCKNLKKNQPNNSNYPFAQNYIRKHCANCNYHFAQHQNKKCTKQHFLFIFTLLPIQVYQNRFSNDLEKKSNVQT